MIHNVFAVHDLKADAYLPPWIMPRTQMAQRVFGDCINSKDHQFSQHPEDYTLFCLGTFDDEKGQFTLFPAKESLGNGVEYVHTDDLFAKEGDHGQKTFPLSNEPPIQSSSEGGNSAE